MFHTHAAHHSKGDQHASRQRDTAKHRKHRSYHKRHSHGKRHSDHNHKSTNLVDSAKATESAQRPETVTVQVNVERLATLDAQAFRYIAKRKEASLELGRVFCEIKKLLGHGLWECHFAEVYEPLGFRLRTAQKYMKRAKAAAKNAEAALFPPAKDAQALQVNDATADAREAVGAAKGGNPNKRPRMGRVRLDGLYRLPIYAKGDQKDNFDALVHSPDWAAAQVEIVKKLEELCVRFGICNDPSEGHSVGQPSTNMNPAAKVAEIQRFPRHEN
jgi:hypothetical protein